MLGQRGELPKTVFPHLGGVLVEQVVAEGGLLRIAASTASTISAPRPDCKVRYARAVTWEELAAGRWQNLPSTLDPYKPYVHQRVARRPHQRHQAPGRTP
jgi:hypothetical protein